MSNLIFYFQHHKLVLFLSLLSLYLFIRPFSPSLSTRTTDSQGIDNMAMVEKSYLPSSQAPAAPVQSQNRLVIKDTILSLQVIDVAQSIINIENLANQLEGYLVESDLNLPESAASGKITIRVPVIKRAEALSQIKSIALKTVSETVSGHDVTDEYVDIDSKLETLNQTKTKFTSILAQAVQIKDILEVQRELINLQAQIDNLKGQKQYLEQSAQLSKITIYLSTDEYALPYTPAESWRPEVIFKTAVRSLVSQLRALGTVLIWIAVYSPVFLIIWLAYFFLHRRIKTQ